MRTETSKLKAKSTADLEREAESLRNEIAKLKLERAANPAKDTNILMKKRKQLAVVLTVLGEKKELEKLTRD